MTWCFRVSGLGFGSLGFRSRVNTTPNILGTSTKLFDDLP